MPFETMPSKPSIRPCAALPKDPEESVRRAFPETEGFTSKVRVRGPWNGRAPG